MKIPIRVFGYLLVFMAASCKKDYSCETCPPEAPGNSPLANAGQDQSITLPANTATLDGTLSYDPDGKLVAYRWSRVSGPSTFILSTGDAVRTQVTDLVAGVYLFELQVTDNDGLTDLDSVQLTVSEDVGTTSCDISDRPLVAARLTPMGVRLEPRGEIAVAAAGGKILFAGGYRSGGSRSSRVNIFTISSGSWSAAELSEPRSHMATAVLGNKIFFAGGTTASGYASSRVDIYDVSADTWTTTELSQARSMMAAGAAGSKVLFAGGFNWADVDGVSYPTKVDIYDVATNRWSQSTLAGRELEASLGIATTVMGSKIYFVGGAGDWPGWDFGSHSPVINIYDAGSDTWSTSLMSVSRGMMAAIAVGDKQYWAGGKIEKQPPYQYTTNQVEIRDMNTGISSFSCLFQPNSGFFTRFEAVRKNNQIVFFTGSGTTKNKFDIYDITTNTWSIGVMPSTVEEAAIISVDHTVYVAGGKVNGAWSDQVWRLEW